MRSLRAHAEPKVMIRRYVSVVITHSADAPQQQQKSNGRRRGGGAGMTDIRRGHAT